MIKNASHHLYMHQPEAFLKIMERALGDASSGWFSENFDAPQPARMPPESLRRKYASDNRPAGFWDLMDGT